VRTSDIARLFEAPGPFVSIYLATEGNVENAAQRVAVRWKSLRAELLGAGVPEGTLEAVDDERTEQVEVEGARTPHLTRSKPGGWSQPRYQHRAEVLWERNATEVAEMLTKMVDRVRPRFVAAAGDLRALELLREQSPKRVQALIEVVGGELGSIDEVLEEAERLAADTAEADTGALLDEFERERGQRDRAADGAEATFEALAMGQVRVLLVGNVRDDGQSAWFGEEFGQVALNREDLIVQGTTPVEGRLVDVAVRAALGTGAEVRVLSPNTDARGPSGGLGAVLRYST